MKPQLSGISGVGFWWMWSFSGFSTDLLEKRYGIKHKKAEYEFG